MLVHSMRTEIVTRLLDGKDITPLAVMVNRAVEAPDMIGTVPGAIGFISSATPAEHRAAIATLETDVDLPQTLIIVTRANPSLETQKVVDAIVKIASGVLRN